MQKVIEENTVCELLQENREEKTMVRKTKKCKLEGQN